MKKSIKINMIMNMLLSVSNFVFPLITYSYVARILLPEGTGKINFAQSVLSIFSYIASLGIYNYGIRECSKVREDREKLSKLAHEIVMVNLIATVIAYILLIGAILLIPKLKSNGLLIIVMSSTMLLNVLGIEWLYVAMEMYSYITIRSLLFKAVSVALIFLFIHTKEDYIIYGGLTIFASSASYILNFINARKYIDFRWIGNYNLKKHIKPIMVFFSSSIIITIYGQFDSLMIGFLKGDVENGIYGAAVKIKSIVTALTASIGSVFIPQITIAFKEKCKASIVDLSTKYMRMICLLVWPIAIFSAICARDLLLFVCGSDYLAADGTLIVLMICTIILTGTNLYGNLILVPSGKEGIVSISVFIGLLINVFGNFLMIPRWGALGAAVATALTETFNLCFMGLKCRTERMELKSNIGLKLYVIPLVVSALVLFGVVHYGVPGNVFFRLVIETIVMFGIYYFSLIGLKEPIIWSVLRKCTRWRNR